jgi:hypothetical protein
VFHDCVAHCVIESATVGVASKLAKFIPYRLIDADAEMALLSVANCDTAGASKVNTWNAVPTLLLIVM